jgi:uncharacterized membrane protein
MVVFHFCYNLAVFDWWDINTDKDLEWRIFRKIIVTSFLLAVGMSSYIAYSKKINLLKLTQSTGKLLSIAALLTLGSLYMYPTTWVYFGIIHFIAIALPVSVLFVRLPHVALFTSLACFICYQLGWISMNPIWLWSKNYINLPQVTIDLVSFIPWISAVLMGSYLMHKNLFNLTIPHNQLTDMLALLGRHSLIIYLIHQPIMYGIMLAISKS